MIFSKFFYIKKSDLFYFEKDDELFLILILLLRER